MGFVNYSQKFLEETGRKTEDRVRFGEKQTISSKMEENSFSVAVSVTQLQLQQGMKRWKKPEVLLVAVGGKFPVLLWKNRTFPHFPQLFPQGVFGQKKWDIVSLFT